MRVVKFARHARGLPPVAEFAELEAIVASGSLGKGGLTKIVSEVESNVVILGEAMQEVTSLTHQRFEENEKEAKSMLGALQSMFATLRPTLILRLLRFGDRRRSLRKMLLGLAVWLTLWTRN